MTLPKAIELLQKDLDHPGTVDFVELNKARKIAIEAVIRVQGNRKYPQPTVYPLLPGETLK